MVVDATVVEVVEVVVAGTVVVVVVFGTVVEVVEVVDVVVAGTVVEVVEVVDVVVAGTVVEVVVVSGTVVDVVVVVAPYGVEKLTALLVTDRSRSSVTTIEIVWFPPSRDRKSKYVDSEVTW